MELVPRYNSGLTQMNTQQADSRCISQQHVLNPLSSSQDQN